MSKEPLVQLSARARATLEQIAHRDGDGRAVRRAQALLWLDAGEPVQQVAGWLGVSRQMLYDTAERYAARAHLPVAARVRDEPHLGRPAAKQAQVVQVIEPLLTYRPTAYGYRAHAWTTGLLQREVAQQVQLAVSDDTVRRALHGLGLRYKRARYVLARRAPHWQQAKGGS